MIRHFLSSFNSAPFWMVFLLSNCYNNKKKTKPVFGIKTNNNFDHCCGMFDFKRIIMRNENEAKNEKKERWNQKSEIVVKVNLNDSHWNDDFDGSRGSNYINIVYKCKSIQINPISNRLKSLQLLLIGHCSVHDLNDYHHIIVEPICLIQLLSLFIRIITFE